MLGANARAPLEQDASNETSSRSRIPNSRGRGRRGRAIGSTKVEISRDAYVDFVLKIPEMNIQLGCKFRRSNREVTRSQSSG